VHVGLLQDLLIQILQEVILTLGVQLPELRQTQVNKRLQIVQTSQSQVGVKLSQFTPPHQNGMRLRNLTILPRQTRRRLPLHSAPASTSARAWQAIRGRLKRVQLEASLHQRRHLVGDQIDVGH